MPELRKSAVDRDPLTQFRRWYVDAEGAEIKAPQAMALATATADGAPSVRMVLLKGADERGFVFFTGLRVEGHVARVAEQESDAYFSTRPRGAQLAAAASQQSSVLRDRAEIDARVDELAREHEGSDVRRPDHWGGYRLVPEVYEFWQHRDDRMHDRLRYRRTNGDWVVERLSP